MIKQQKIVHWAKRNWPWFYPILSLLFPLWFIVGLSLAVLYGLGAALISIFDDDERGRQM